MGENTSLSAAVLLPRGKDCTRPAIHWYLRKFNVEFCDAVTVFKHTRFFDPVVAQSLKLTSEKIEALQHFSFLQESAPQLQAELPTYLAAIKDVELTTDEQKLEWWSRQTEVPGWSAAVSKLLVVQPSSAASERVFSLMNTFFNKQQEHTLESTIETALMLRFN